ncbi:MAG: hypothetical protein JWM47_4463 [Acidimicrobiales bacterium]|nr:hypothetical protein [Acidimicrobiales bacterium]
MTTERARAKSLILAWLDKGSPKAEQRRRLARDIDRFFDTIAARTGQFECLSTLLDDKGAVTFSMSGHGWRATPSARGLVVSSVVPGWNFGWRNLLEDEMSDHFFSGIGHYFRQYLHRSNISKILMAVWERNGIILHPFGTDLIVQRYSDSQNILSTRTILDAADAAIKARWGSVSYTRFVYRSKWSKRNTLDPAIHQAIFHFLRAQNLAFSEFNMESLAAFDCVLHSLQSMDWSWAPGKARRDRADLCAALGLGPQSANLANHVYFLRNQFVAHAGGWRWWDTDDYLEDDLTTKVSGMVSRALRRAADIEPRHRSIDPTPVNWASWCEANFPKLWGAVWFRDPP